MERSCCEWKVVECAFKNNIERCQIVNNKHLDLDSFFNDAKILFNDKIVSVLQQKEMIKVFTVLNLEMVMMEDGEELCKVTNFHSSATTIYIYTNLNEYFDKHVKDFMIGEFEKYQEKGSGWSLKSVAFLDVCISLSVPFRGSSYVPLPTVILKKKACINVKNDDEECFKWAILSAIHPQPDRSGTANRKTTYELYKNELDFRGITFPISITDIRKFEKQNPTISVNVYILKREINNIKDICMDKELVKISK